MPSFTREFVLTTQDDLKANWSGVGKRAFFCAFCLHDFELGDDFRMLYTNDMKGAGGNPLTCRTCWTLHGQEGLRNKWREMWEEYRTRFRWWWCRD